MSATTTQSKKVLQAMAVEIQSAVNARGTHVFVGTWCERSGVSIEIRFQSKTAGKRIAIHKWDGDDFCEVRYITGDFWRGRDKAREFAKSSDVPFSADAIIAVIREQVATSRER